MTASEAHNAARPRVLVIDDSVDVHRLLRARLKHEDLDVVSAEGGAEGLEAADNEPPAIVLLDLSMPEVDGFEVLRRLKDNPKLADIPVIVLSGLSSSQDKVTAFDLGAVDYITKPFDLTELRVRVRSALRMSQLMLMLAQKAQIDGLTGLWNRAYLDSRWPQEVAACHRHERPLSLALLDADHFKSINDLYGHPAGDKVLEGIAQAIRSQIRESDVACRYGGEEFAILMPETTTPEAFVVCERIRQHIESITWARHPERTVTISIGLCGASKAPSEDAAAWLECADKLLYASKQNGRNRVTMEEIAVEQLRTAG
ncbi:MAG: diguanylate cyclase [Planctomycetota bacterium]